MKTIWRWVEVIVMILRMASDKEFVEGYIEEMNAIARGE